MTMALKKYFAPSPAANLPKTIRKIAISLIIGLGLTTQAIADEADEVSKLIQAQSYDQALARADAYLANRPNDPQMRFLKGLVLTERNQIREAIVVFTKLTEDYPELPEPYNNLAVLYAGQGEYDKARASLEMAIRTHPSYATAYENLGDVYAKLASQSYDKALQLDGRNATAQTKLSMVRNLISGKTIIQQEVVAAADPEPVTPTTVAESPPVVVATPPVVAPTVAVATSVAPSNAIPARAEAPTNTLGVDKDVLSAVEAWAKAWSDQDMQGYLAAYGSEFEPPRGMSRSTWENQREKRIVGKDTIRVVVDNPLITVTGDTAVVKFKQSYFSNRLNNVANKTLTLRLENGQWRITKEQVTG